MVEQFVLIAFEDEATFAHTSPFKIAAELRRLVGEVAAAKPTAAGKLLITTRNSKQTEELLKQSSFLGKGADFSFPDHKNSTEAYVYAPSLLEVSEEELLEELKTQGVIGVSRLRPKNDQKNPGLRFRFRGRSVPQGLRAGFEDFELRPWRRSPLLCRRCASYGHTSRHCRNDQLRCLRCSEQHTTDDCQSSSTCCPQCAADHAAWDRRCPVLKEFFKNQANRREAPAQPRKRTTEASTQTTTAPKKNVATEPKITQVKTTSVQTDDLPVFTGPVPIIEDSSKPEDTTNPDKDPGPESRRGRTGQMAPPHSSEHPGCGGPTASP